LREKHFRLVTSAATALATILELILEYAGRVQERGGDGLVHAFFNCTLTKNF